MSIEDYTDRELKLKRYAERNKIEIKKDESWKEYMGRVEKGRDSKRCKDDGRCKPPGFTGGSCGTMYTPRKD